MHPLFQFVLVVLLAQLVLSQKGLNATVVLSQCASQCGWYQPEIWIGGTVPTPSDTVDIQVDGTYTIVIATDVTVADFQIGFDDDDHGSQYFKVTNAARFTSTSNFKAFLSASVTVDAYSFLNCNGQGTVNGYFQLVGAAYFGGSSPSLYVDSTNIQISFNFVTGELEFMNGQLTVVNGLQISTTSTLTGTGNIDGSVQMNGDFEPGLNGVGTFYINGSLNFNTLSNLKIDVASEFSYDRVILTGTCNQDGQLTVSPKGSYEPLSHTQFYVMNHTAQRNGFKVVKGSGFLSLFADKWSAVVDQSYTALIYDSASSVLISFAMIAACILFTLL